MTSKEKKYIEVKIEKSSEVINVSTESLWQILKEFNNVEKWISLVDKCESGGEIEFEGAPPSERICVVQKIGRVVEKLTMYNEAEREFAYELTEGAPGFILFAGNHFSISEIGPNQSILNMNVTTQLSKFPGFLLGGFLRKSTLKNLDIILEDLKIYAETGEVSRAKKAQLQKLEKKMKKAA